MNPFEEMEKYSREDLEKMSVEELLVVQRSILFPDEQALFDAGESLPMKVGDGRVPFFDFTDALICARQLESRGREQA